MVADPSSVKVYTVNGAASGSSSSLPDWLTRKRAANRKSKREIREHIEGTIELIQHFEFPEASNRIKTTRDGHHAIATGTYKPQMRVWDLDQLSLKFERHSDAENVDFIILSEDWTKTIHLQNDRSIQLHNQSGLYYSTRIPRFGRALGYHSPSCDALVAATGPEVYRLNLDQGRFLNPLLLQGDGNEEISGVNCIDINSAHQLWAFGCEGNGSVELWDPRSRTKVGLLRLPSNRLMPTNLTGMESPLSVTAISSRSDGLSYVVGTSTGHSLLYDIRSARPYATKDQGYGLPVKKVSWIEGGHKVAGDGMILSADKKVIKIWDRNDPSTNFTSITPANDLNDVHHIPSSGLIMLANEGIQMTTYYIPQLGPAPRWCSFLENITEEMEDQTARTVYEDYKFVDRNELSTLGLDHLIGTPALKPYMHGYFLSLKLYDTARAIANPFAYAEHREQIVRDKIEKMTESRIRAPKNLVANVKVNKGLAERMAKEEQREQTRKNKKQRKLESTTSEGESGKMVVDDDTEQPSLVNDPRFKALFEDPDFEVDENSRAFALMNPSLAAKRKEKRMHEEGKNQRNIKTKTAVEEEDEDANTGSSSHDSSDSRSSDENLDEDDSSGDDDLVRSRIPPTASQNQKHGSKRVLSTVRLVPLQTRGAEGQNGKNREATFGQRRNFASRPSQASTRSSDRIGQTADGSMEMSWIPSSSKRKSSTTAGEVNDVRNSRKGVESFGLGMEKGRPSSSVPTSESERSGRTQRRKGMRSGSKNTFRKI